MLILIIHKYDTLENITSNLFKLESRYGFPL